MKNKILSTTLWIGMVGFSNAATFISSNVGDGKNDTLYALSDDIPLTDGITAIGTFTKGFDVTSNLNNIDLLISNFNPLTSARINTPCPDLSDTAHAGYVQGGYYDAGALTESSLIYGLQLYLFVGEKESLLASDAFALVDMGTIGADTPTIQEFVCDPASVAPAAILIGKTGAPIPGDYAGKGVSSNFKTLQLVPEPSTMLLTSIASLGLLRRRRSAKA